MSVGRVEAHLPLVLRKLGKFRRPAGMTRDDLISAGNLGLVLADRSYRDGSMSFESWASWHIENQMRDEIRDYRRKDGLSRTSLRRFHLVKFAGGIFGSELPTDRPSPHDWTLRRERLRILAARATDRRQKFVVLARLSGWEFAEIGRAIDRSQSLAHRLWSQVAA